jgi:hypothetical protein
MSNRNTPKALGGSGSLAELAGLSLFPFTTARRPSHARIGMLTCLQSVRKHVGTFNPSVKQTRGEYILKARNTASHAHHRKHRVRMLETACMRDCMKFASPGRHQLNNSDSATELTSLRVCSQLDHELNAVIADYS